MRIHSNPFREFCNVVCRQIDWYGLGTRYYRFEPWQSIPDWEPGIDCNRFEERIRYELQLGACLGFIPDSGFEWIRIDTGMGNPVRTFGFFFF